MLFRSHRFIHGKFHGQIGGKIDGKKNKTISQTLYCTVIRSCSIKTSVVAVVPTIHRVPKTRYSSVIQFLSLVSLSVSSYRKYSILTSCQPLLLSISTEVVGWGMMTNSSVITLTIVSMILPLYALRVTINGKVTGLPHFAPTIHQPIKLPVWPVWSGVIAQCFDWLKAAKISEAITSSIGGRVVPISLSNLDVSPFLLLAHHSHSFTPLDPVR